MTRDNKGIEFVGDMSWFGVCSFDTGMGPPSKGGQ